MERVVGTQEASELLGVKPHVLRYWEQEVPLISPVRDSGGRKVYREADLRLLFRLRHLVVEKKYTLEGALERILDEASPDREGRKALLEEVKGELLALRRLLHRQPPAPDAAPAPAAQAPAPAAQAAAPDAAPAPAAQPPAPVAQPPAPGRRETRRSFVVARLDPRRLADAPRRPPRIPLYREEVGPWVREASQELLGHGEICFVTLSHLFLAPREGLPAETVPVLPDSRRSLLEHASQRMRGLSYRLGRPLRWMHLVWSDASLQVSRHLEGIDPLYRPTLLPVPGAAGSLELPEAVRPVGRAPFATLIAHLTALEEYPAYLHLFSLEEIGPPLFDGELLAVLLARGGGGIARAVHRGAAGWRLRGPQIFSVDALRRAPLPLESSAGSVDTQERQVSLGHLLEGLGGATLPWEGEFLRPGRYDRWWPQELSTLWRIHFRRCREALGLEGGGEIDPLYAEDAEELRRRRRFARSEQLE